MKILLISPQNINVIEPFISSPKPPPKFLWGFPIGLGYLGSFLEVNGFDVEILDACNEELDISATKERIIQSRASVVGINTLAATIKTAVVIAQMVKKLNPTIPVIAGGVHATYDYQNLLKNYPIDFVVLGEGERTLLELMWALKENKHIRNVKGLAYLNNGEVRTTLPRPLIDDLDILPYPARHLVDFDKYIKTTLLPNALYIITSRGCTHRCAFCSSGHFFRRWRARSPLNIINEMEFLINKYSKIESFIFLDDNFTYDKKRVIELCNLIIERKLNRYKWSCLARVDQVDLEMLASMRKAGCEKINYGVESGSPEILKNINKAITPDMAEEAIETTRKMGIEAMAFFMLGNPGETQETIDLSARFAARLKSSSTVWFVTSIYPGTKLSQLQPINNFTEYLYEPEVYHPSPVVHPCVPVFINPGLDREMLKTIQKKLARRFLLHHLLHHGFMNFLVYIRHFVRSPLNALRYFYHLVRSE